MLVFLSYKNLKIDTFGGCMFYKYFLVLFINLFTFIARFKNIIKKIQFNS